MNQNHVTKVITKCHSNNIAFIVTLVELFCVDWLFSTYLDDSKHSKLWEINPHFCISFLQKVWVKQSPFFYKFCYCGLLCKINGLLTIGWSTPHSFIEFVIVSYSVTELVYLLWDEALKILIRSSHPRDCIHGVSCQIWIYPKILDMDRRFHSFCKLWHIPSIVKMKKVLNLP